MANSKSSTSPSEIQVNGATHAWEPDVQSQITLALVQNGGIERIKATFRQRLDEAGWSQDLKEYCTRLFRSGAATTYDDALSIVMRNINSDGEVANGVSEGAPDLSIPREAAEGGAEAVRKELRQVVVMKKPSTHGDPGTDVPSGTDGDDGDALGNTDNDFTARRDENNSEMDAQGETDSECDAPGEIEEDYVGTSGQVDCSSIYVPSDTDGDFSDTTDDEPSIKPSMKGKEP